MDKKLSRKQEKVINLLHELSLKDQDILIRRFIQNETQKSVGERYNMTNERVRQLEERALKLIEENV